MQPVKIVDPHLVSSVFDNYKRVYLHCTAELINKSSKFAECSLNIQVVTELEGNICSVEHLQTKYIFIPAGAHVHYRIPKASCLISNFNTLQLCVSFANTHPLDD